MASFAVEGKALAASTRVGVPVGLADVGSTATSLFIWRTGFRYAAQAVVGYGTGVLEAGQIHYGACVSFLTLNGHFLTSEDDAKPLVTGFRTNMPSDTEAFILLHAHDAASQASIEYGDTVILRRVNGRYLNCTQRDSPGFRSVQCSWQERFRIWF